MTERLHFHFSLSCIGEGNGNPLQYSCLENPRDRGAWWAAVYGVTQSQTRLKRLSSSSSNRMPGDAGTTADLGPHLETQAFTSRPDAVRCWPVVSTQFSSVSQSCPTLYDSMDCSTPGFPVHHPLLELTQTQVHQVSDAIQPPHPLLFPSPPTFNLSQHQDLFQRVSSSHPVAIVLEFQLQHQSFQ